jgi:ATP-dependent phosphofructokinase / diphosphate-dependent phosphofructokinase
MTNPHGLCHNSTILKKETTMSQQNIFYAQSGGVTSVINASACGVIEQARKHPETFGTVYAGQDGIIGALNEALIDTANLTTEEVAMLKHTPGGAFGSCRYKLKNIEDNKAEYQRLIEVFKAHNIGYFFYNGGGDSQDTAHKVAQMAQQMNLPLQCIGIPKTIDNDLPHTDTCPGFGSVAKYVAISTLEASLDVASMAASSTKVFILEVMGRHAGWIAAAAGLAQHDETQAPHIILMPERPINEDALMAKVKHAVEHNGFCTIVASEGIKNAQGDFLAEAGGQDAFGHKQLGGVAPVLASMIQHHLGYKYHWAVADYLQRSARHIASKTDVDQAYALGKAAVNAAMQGKNQVMMNIVRDNTSPYQWHIDQVPLASVANIEKTLPDDFITEDGMHITTACKQALAPFIQGEDYPPYHHGLPVYFNRRLPLIEKKLTQWD